MPDCPARALFLQFTANVPPTDRSLHIANVQVGDVPLQAPVHSTNVSFFVVLAVNVTLVPAAKVCAHCFPQLSPLGLLTTVPEPVKATLSVNC